MGSFAAPSPRNIHVAAQKIGHTYRQLGSFGQRPGADARGLTQRRAVAMKIFCQILSCWAVVFFIAVPHGVTAHARLLHVSDVLACLDSMETVPMSDDVVPTPIAVDDGCMVSEAVILI